MTLSLKTDGRVIIARKADRRDPPAGDSKKGRMEAFRNPHTYTPSPYLEAVNGSRQQHDHSDHGQLQSGRIGNGMTVVSTCQFLRPPRLGCKGKIQIIRPATGLKQRGAGVKPIRDEDVGGSASRS
jgi:hypothetical protein